jgi:hypothetical protein
MSTQEPNQDQYIKSLFEEGGTEEPSRHFTNNIIDAINAKSASSTYTYKPIISKSAWLTMAFIGIAAFLYLLFVSPASSQGTDFYGYSLNFDLSKVKGLLSKVAFSFELTPILKTSIIALFIFTFSNLLIFELKNKSMFKR